jgi:hypothetical protein
MGQEGSWAMRKEDEYLREAEDAQKWAERSKSEKAKAVWLRIAASWMSLFRGLTVEKEAFEALAGKKATHEGEPKSRH